MGRRFFKERLLTPSVNIDIIEKSYENIHLYSQDNFYNDIRSSLGKISDLEKSLRNMGLEDLYDTNNLFSDSVAYDFVLKTIKSIVDYERINISNHVVLFDEFREYVDYIKSVFEFDNFSSVSSNNSIEKSIFKRGFNSDIDELDDKINEHLNNIHRICEKFSDMIDNKKNVKAVRYDYNDKNDHFIYCIKKRGLTIMDKFKNMNNKSICL